MIFQEQAMISNIIPKKILYITYGVNPKTQIYFTISFKVKKAVIKDKIKGINISIILIFSSSKISGEMKSADNSIVGIEIIKDILIASYLLYPKILKPVIDIPDLETPGIKAKA